jgi:hypothetical protein
MQADTIEYKVEAGSTQVTNYITEYLYLHLFNQKSGVKSWR